MLGDGVILVKDATYKAKRAVQEVSHRSLSDTHADESLTHRSPDGALVDVQGRFGDVLSVGSHVWRVVTSKRRKRSLSGDYWRSLEDVPAINWTFPGSA